MGYSRSASHHASLFAKDATVLASKCLTAAMLEVGMQHRQNFRFTREQVETYCALAGDMNAIHRDVEAARLRFPEISDIVVPGGLIQIAVTGLFGSELPGDGTLGLTFSPDRFRKPVCLGDTITVTIEVTRIRGALVEMDVWVDDAEGTRVGTAKSRLIAPDETYRRWWQAQQPG
jgi:acyl dehydratase